MHNRYYIEVDNENKWGRVFSFGELFFSFDEAVKYAKTLLASHDAVRVVDKCYGIVRWQWVKSEV